MGMKAEKQPVIPWAVHFVVLGVAAVHIDVLTRLDEAFDYASLASERIDFDGATVSIVTPETLYRMKKSIVRPKDWGDAQRIARHFGLKD